MALNNCTISSTTATFTKTGGIVLGPTTAVLTISPNTGYTVSASDFFNNTGGLPEVATITLSDSGTPGSTSNTVLVTILLNAGFTMLSANHTVTVDIDGEAIKIVYSIAGTYDFTVNSSSSITQSESIGTSYSNTGAHDETETLFSVTYTPATNYEWVAEPTAELNLGPFLVGQTSNYNNYTITKTGSGSTSARTFTVQYKYPAYNHSADKIIFKAVLRKKPIKDILGVRINNYSVNTDYVSPKGESRELMIIGDSGAKFSLEVYTGQDSYTRGTVANSDAILTTKLEDQTLGSSGFAKIRIPFAPSSASKIHTITLKGDLNTNLKTNHDAAVTTLQQLADVALTVTLSESGGSTMTIPSSQVTSTKASGTRPINSDGSRGDAYSFSFDVASASSDLVYTRVKARRINWTQYLTKTASSGWSLQLTSIGIENNGHATNTNFVIAFKVLQYGIDNVTITADLTNLFKVLSSGTNTPNNVSREGSGTLYTVSDPYNTAEEAAGDTADASDTTVYGGADEPADIYEVMTATDGTTGPSLVDEKFYKFRKGVYNSGNREYIGRWDDTNEVFERVIESP